MDSVVLVAWFGFVLLGIPEEGGWCLMGPYPDWDICAGVMAGYETDSCTVADVGGAL